jgi:hypothetical protein
MGEAAEDGSAGNAAGRQPGHRGTPTTRPAASRAADWRHIRDGRRDWVERCRTMIAGCRRRGRGGRVLAHEAGEVLAQRDGAARRELGLTPMAHPDRLDAAARSIDAVPDTQGPATRHRVHGSHPPASWMTPSLSASETTSRRNNERGSAEPTRHLRTEERRSAQCIPVEIATRLNRCSRLECSSPESKAEHEAQRRQADGHVHEKSAEHHHIP